MQPTYTREELLRMTKKQLVQLCGYPNIKALCRAHPELLTDKGAPSRKQLVKALL